MRRFVDLHTHSTASDGQLAPSRLIQLAESHKLAAVALTDHDTTSGLAEARAAAREFPKLHFVPGIEVSARFDGGTLHILGLDIDETNMQLQATLQQLRDARNERNPRIIAALCKLGAEITMEDVIATAGSFDPGKPHEIIGRMHIAETLRRKRFVKTIEEAFKRFLGDKAPAYVDKERMTPSDAVGAIRASGGVAVLAHPPQLNCENYAQVERVLRSLMRAGLNGIEAYHTENSPEETRFYLNMARKHNLVVTGGSDFHGKSKEHAVLGRPRVPLAAITGELGHRLQMKAAEP